MITKTADWSKWSEKSNNFHKYSHIKSELIYGKPQSNQGTLSIMILTYKRASGLQSALDSALKQDYPGPYTVVVLDDSGFDKETDELMRNYCSSNSNILYYRHEKNLGQYANWNRACELSPTNWYCLLHDDDILKPDYLRKLAPYTNDSELGLLGVYIDVNDMREEASTQLGIVSRVFLAVQNLFIRLRGGAYIPLYISDNIRHIYVMNSTFINKALAFDVGGLDDKYFPSSDFAFSAKMAYHHKTGFVPLRLTEKGIGESESLKQSVCDDSIRCAYYQTIEMCKSKGMSIERQKRKASIAAVISEIGVKGYNNVDYGVVKNSLSIPRLYNQPVIILIINIYSKLMWGLLLFRKGKE